MAATTTKMTFETAQLSDALNKASRLAPFKGAAFDKAGGFLLDVKPSERRMTVRATDLDATYLQHIPCTAAKGDEAQWRLPSLLLSGMVSSLPMGSEAKVDMIDRGDGFIRLTSDKWVSKLHMLRASDFPIIREFKTDELKEANEFASKVEQVAWACDKKSPILAGVHIDGTRLIGCSQYGVAVIPCPATIDNPATVPLASLATILRTATDVRLGVAERELQIALDAETQATSRLLLGAYPDVDRVLRDDYIGHVMVNKEQFLDSVNRMLVLVRSERMPAMQVTFDGTGLVQLLTFDIEVEQTGRMQDSVDVIMSGTLDHHQIRIQPQMLVNAVEHSRDTTVKISYGNEDPALAAKVSLKVSDDQGYVSHIMPIFRES